MIEVVRLYVKPLNTGMYKYPEIAKTLGMVMFDGRLCIGIEFDDGNQDFIPMLSEGKDWIWCDSYGEVVERKE